MPNTKKVQAELLLGFFDKMDEFHREILVILKKRSKEAPSGIKRRNSYEGHNDFVYPLGRGEERKLTVDFLKTHSEISLSEFINLLDLLYQGQSVNEKELAGLLLEKKAAYRQKIIPAKLDRWLDHLVGWLEVDSLCQSNFGAKEMLANWPEWEKLIRQLSQNANINKRRASLVLLIKPNRQLKDQKLAGLALAMIDNLKNEKSRLITKAISWLLREMVKNQRELVKDYFERNRQELPPVVVREVSHKLKIGSSPEVRSSSAPGVN